MSNTIRLAGVFLALAALAACNPVEKIVTEQGYLYHNPPSTFPQIGDVWGVTSSPGKSVLNLICRNDQPPKVITSLSQDHAVNKEFTGNAEGDVTADVNALLGEVITAPLPANMPQINATARGSGQFVRKATYKVSDVNLHTTDRTSLQNSFDAAIQRGLCRLQPGERVFVVWSTLSASVTYSLEWQHGFTAEEEAELAKLLKEKMQGKVGFSGSRTVTGQALVYGLRLFNPRQPDEHVTATSLGLIGKWQVLQRAAD